jgi:formylmethanofuran dehydrogenase subunit E
MKKNIHTCSECGKTVIEEKIFFIDDRPVCLTCIYGQTKPFEVYPIGKVRNELKTSEKDLCLTGAKGISCIDLIPSQNRFMYKLEEERFLTILYYLHEIKSVKSIFKRALDEKEVGVFASRTPYRLSKIGIQDVKLVKIEGTTLYVEGLDAINGSPVLDIKLKWSTLN